MGEAELRLVQTWTERLASAEDPVEVWYEQIWAPDIDYRAIEGAPDDVGPISGRDAMRSYLSDWYEMFEDFTAAPEEVLDVGAGRVVVTWHIAGTAKASGVLTDMRVAAAYTIAGGKVVRGREYLTKEEALAALERET